mmetsp:Transcript_49626/g.146663  ORF Transcript_49626/g.146663 Transcript_49626/m.146663 type:complete len:271 (-) Transcript_49626:4509-5321(-)
MKTACRTSFGSNSPGGSSGRSSSMTSAGGGPTAPNLSGCGKLSWRSRTLRHGASTAAHTRSRKYSFVHMPISFCARQRNFRSGCEQMTSAQRRAPSSRLRLPRRSTESTGSGPTGAASSPSSSAAGSPPMAAARAMLPRSWMKLSQSSMLVSRGRLARHTAMVVAPSSPMPLEATETCITLLPASTSARKSSSMPLSPRRLWLRLTCVSTGISTTRGSVAKCTGLRSRCWRSTEVATAKACEKSTSPGRVTEPWESGMMSPCSSSASSFP